MMRAGSSAPACDLHNKTQNQKRSRTQRNNPDPQCPATARPPGRAVFFFAAMRDELPFVPRSCPWALVTLGAALAIFRCDREEPQSDHAAQAQEATRQSALLLRPVH